MADIRALLRNELASRTTESRSASKAGARVVKKRKLNSEDEPVRKRTKPAKGDLPPQHEVGEHIVPVEATRDGNIGDISPVLESLTPPDPPELSATADTVIQPNIVDSAPQVVDEEEWAAFEREVVAPTRIASDAVTALNTAATISAAPISAAELSVRDQQEAASGSGARELEALGEKEDAARYLEEEFDEMDQLEERVKRLKEKREDIRRRRQLAGDVDAEVEDGFEDQHLEDDLRGSGYASEVESEGDEGDDSWDDWILR